MFFFGAVSSEVAARPLGGWHNGIIIAGVRTVVRVPTAPRLLRTALAMSNFAFLLPAFHSITSSARIRSDGGIDSCRAFARDDLPPPNEHLARKETLLSRALKHERVCYAIVGRTSPSADREGPSDPFTGGYPLVGQMIPARRVAHSITSSARARSVGGIVRPRALAVLRLTMSSTLVDCTTGSSAGFAFKNAPNIDADLPREIGEIAAVAHEAASGRERAKDKDRRQRVAHC